MAEVSVAVFLQARLGSTRLPQKVLLPLGSSTVIEMAMTRLRSLDVDHYVLLCDEDSKESLEPLANNCGFEIFAGDAEDVLKRYLDAAQQYQVDVIIRATGDNPLVSPQVAEASLMQFLRYKCDFFAFDKLPLGSGVELVSRSALKKAYTASSERYDHEHVCPYIYHNQDKFFVVKHKAPAKWSAPTIHITLDTSTDYRHLQNLISKSESNKLEVEEIIKIENYLRSGVK